ncbi:N-acetyltransferase [Azotosporobacter soli]|uniref:GNAT family N-acetyltransferase n=1 Tax=Azotosporobacter soli TaxID=3055040 RepID=UPI0031FE72A7
MTICVRNLTEGDIPAVAALFNACFAASVLHHCRGRLPKAAAMEDVFSLVRRAEAQAAFGVWSENGALLGYCFAPTSLGRLWRIALGRGGVLYWAWRWLKGDYGIGLWPLRLILVNKLGFIRSALTPGQSAGARILSIAVNETARGAGCGQALLTTALAYQKRQGAKKVRLEVRPENRAALRLYERNGFVPGGKTADSQGDWLIMWKEMADKHVGSETAPR